EYLGTCTCAVGELPSRSELIRPSACPPGKVFERTLFSPKLASPHGLVTVPPPLTAPCAVGLIADTEAVAIRAPATMRTIATTPTTPWARPRAAPKGNRLVMR